MKIMMIALFTTCFMADARSRPEASEVAGRYEIQDFEKNGALLLRGDKTYVFEVSYRAGIFRETGKWKLDKSIVTIAGETNRSARMATVLPTGSQFVFAKDRLINKTGQFTKPLIDPRKTSTPQPSATCEAIQDSAVEITGGSLAEVKPDAIEVQDPQSNFSYLIDRKWAKKALAGKLNEKKLFSLVEGAVPKSKIICKKKMSTGEGRIKVFGKLVHFEGDLSEDDLFEGDLFIVQMGLCYNFAVEGIGAEKLKVIQGTADKIIDAQLPRSSMIGFGGCVDERP